MPITLDENGTTSHAEWRVAPITVNGKNGIEIRIRHCNTVVFTGARDDGSDYQVHLRPAAHVVDASGKVFFNTTGSAIDWVQPTGSQVFDNTSQGDDLQRIVVPVKGASGALTIRPLCTSYPGAGMGPSYTFAFKPCTTTTRSCATRTAGTGELRTGP